MEVHKQPQEHTMDTKSAVELQICEPDIPSSENESQKDTRMTWRKIAILVSMSMLWIASQISLYLYGAVIPLLIKDLGGADRAVWVTLSNLIPISVVTPFVSQMCDLLGRRNVSLAAAALLVIGNIVCGTATTMNNFIAGMSLIGCGAGVLEMTALAVAGEMAPAQKRGLYIGAVVATVIPYAPSVLYAQWVASHSWRWLSVWIGAWSFVGLVLTAVSFFPPKRPSLVDASQREVLASIDYVGGFLSTAGLTLFLAALTWGGNQYAWDSVHVVVPLVLGIVLIIAFVYWEVRGAKTPMFPRRLWANPRALNCVLAMTAVSGAVFFTVLICWPTQYNYVYAINGDPVSIGLGSLPIAFCFLGGSIIASIAMSYSKSRVKILLFAGCVIMIAGNGALAGAKVDNLQAMFGPLVLACLGCGAIIVPCQIIATVISPDDLIATVIALTITIRFVSGSIAFAIYSSIQTQQFTQTSWTFVGAAARSIGITDVETVGGIIQLVKYGLGPQIRAFVATDDQWELLLLAGRQAYAASYAPVYYCAIGFGTLAIVAVLLLPDISASMDQHVAVAY
ncbi:hypothetical protein PG995_013258 [Apiospora arundinis]